MANLYAKANASATDCLKKGNFRMAQIWIEICGKIISAMESGENENSPMVKYLVVYIINLENGIVL